MTKRDDKTTELALPLDNQQVAACLDEVAGLLEEIPDTHFPPHEYALAEGGRTGFGGWHALRAAARRFWALAGRFLRHCGEKTRDEFAKRTVISGGGTRLN